MTLRSECKKRRQKLFEKIGNEAVAIVFSSKKCIRSGNTNYPYRQSSSLYYLTGFPEAESIALFLPGRKEGEYVLFHQEAGKEQKVWNDEFIGQIGALEQFDVDQSFPIHMASSIIPDLMRGRNHVYFEMFQDEKLDHVILKWLEVAKSKSRIGSFVPSHLSNICDIVDEMRLIKDSYEVDLLKKSASISAKAHLRAMNFCKPLVSEHEIVAELCHEYLKNEGCSISFEPIVAEGANACVLHYNKKRSELQDGNLVLIDSGNEYKYYNSDITRTIPVGKKFSKEQRAIYQAVLETQLAIIHKVKPGVRWNELQETSELIISEKLLSLGILKGTLEEVISEQKFKRFYMHRIGHFIGIDVHDVGKYSFNGQWRMLEKNMVLTVEPGIYISSENEDVDKKWWNIGVRIEDAVLVTENGCEVLTSNVPKTIEEIESMR